MDTLRLAAFFAALHRAGIDDATPLSIDVTGGHLTVRAYDPAQSTAILAALGDVRAVHGYEPGQVKRWHGTLAGTVVRLIHARKALPRARVSITRPS